jgi:hypothetical protein
MSNGAVIIANDTNEIEYVRMARVAARLVTRNLGIPVALITDIDTNYPEFEKTIVVPRGNNNVRTTAMGNTHQTMSWYNLGRTDVYDLTPWDRTLVIDADFFIMTDALKTHMDAAFDFAIAKNIHNPTNGFTAYATLSKTKINHMWATVMIFNKSTKAKAIFELAKHVIKHYKTYAKIYDFETTHIRNDYAFSIACHLLGGYGEGDLSLRNYSMTNVYFNNKIRKIRSSGEFIIEYSRLYKNEPRQYIAKLGLSDTHFLNKLSLMEHIDELEQL